MTGQNAMRSDIRHKPIAAAVGEQAPLKLEQFLPYQLNVVATLVSQALSRVYAAIESGYRNGACWSHWASSA
jgi:hypothetical protein